MKLDERVREPGEKSMNVRSRVKSNKKFDRLFKGLESVRLWVYVNPPSIEWLFANFFVEQLRYNMRRTAVNLEFLFWFRLKSS